MEGLINKLQSQLLEKREMIIKEAIAEKGITLDFGKLNLVTNDEDEFEHLYYNFGQPGESKVLSISKVPEIEYLYRDEFNKNNITIQISFKYY